MYLFLIIFIFVVLCLLLNCWRRASIIKKVRSLMLTEKCRLLNELICPFGYQYNLCQDIFYSTFDAWQREFGYKHSYDCFAPYVNMVFDCEPVYFNYEGRTWLIELWKGQYGINTGTEIGIYRADKILSPQERNRTLFHSVPDKDIPVFSLDLIRSGKENAEEIASLSMPHWWLAAFRMGVFSKPENLCADFCINFQDCKMMYAFADALIRLGYDTDSMQICNSSICFTFRTPLIPVTCCFLTKIARCISQWENRLFCRLYRFITRPFCCTPDRLYYLYLYLPFIFRHCLRLHRRRKCRRKACGR